MSNPLKGEVALDLGDRTLRLVLDHEALIQAESAYGKPLPLLLADAIQGFQGAKRAILFGALRTFHPEVSLRAAADMLADHGDAVNAALDAASAAAFPKAEGDRDAGNAPAPLGKPSGASGAKQGSNRTRSGGKRPKPTR